MSKGFNGGYGRMGGFGGMNMNQLMKQAKQMQADMEKSQEELSSKTFESTSGGGAVTVKVNGSKEVLELKIAKEAVDPDDVEMLQDLILAALNDALKKVDSATSQEFGKYNLPGLGF